MAYPGASLPRWPDSLCCQGQKLAVSHVCQDQDANLPGSHGTFQARIEGRPFQRDLCEAGPLTGLLGAVATGAQPGLGRAEAGEALSGAG